jgi:hypothetical protein
VLAGIGGRRMTTLKYGRQYITTVAAVKHYFLNFRMLIQIVGFPCS